MTCKNDTLPKRNSPNDGIQMAQHLIHALYDNQDQLVLAFASELARVAVENNTGEYQRKIYEIAYAITEAFNHRHEED